MAPRAAKTKKANVKVGDNDAPKKGRGKAKNVEELELAEPEIEEKTAPPTDNKKKRGKKAANEAIGQINGNGEETAPLAKRGRKKNKDEPTPEEKTVSNEENSADEEFVNQDNEQNGNDYSDTNSQTEETQTVKSGKGRKRQTKKEVGSEKAEKGENKSKPANKGRGRKALTKEKETKTEGKIEPTEESVEAPPAKGRKRAAKVKETTPESENEEFEEEKGDKEKPVEESKKKEVKGRKNQGKKTQAKEDIQEEERASKKRKIAKKAEKPQGETKTEEPMEDEASETKAEPEKPVKGKRGQKKGIETPTEETEAQDTGELATKRRRKPADDKASTDDSKKKAPPKNKATTEYDENYFVNSSKNTQEKDWNFKIASWNVDGIRAWMNKGGLDYLKYEKPDILCLQETKCSRDKLPDDIANLPGYHAYWLCSEKDGYAGVGIYTTKLAMHVQYGLQNEDLDSEGRIITAEYEQFYLICTYVPNAGRKLVTLPKRLQWNEEFRKYVNELDKKKPVIICGDMNVAHNEIDLANPKTNRKNAGFTDEERAGMTDLLGDGFVDTYRHLYANTTGAYTFWTYMSNSRAKNVGWRLDYFIVSERLLPSLCDNVIRDKIYGSDHCPITLFLHLSSADKPKE